MKNKFSISKLLSLLLAVVLLSTMFFTGCKDKSKDKDKANNPDSTISQVDDSDSEKTDTEDDELIDDEEIDFDDEDFDDDFDLDEFLDEFNVTEASLEVKNGSEPLVSDFLGQSAEYFSYIYMNEHDGKGRGYTQEMIDLEIERVVQSGVTIVRGEFYPAYMFNYETKQYDFSTKYMQTYYKFLTTMKENGIDVAVAPCWSYTYLTDLTDPNGMKNPLFILADENGDNTLSEAEQQKTIQLFGEWVALAVKNIVVDEGYSNFKYLVLFTEPAYSGSSVSVEDAIEKAKGVIAPTVAVDTELKKLGIRKNIKIVGPNTVGYNGIHQLEYLALKSEAKDCYDVLGYHIYLQSNYTRDVYDSWSFNLSQAKEIADKAGKEIWLDEFNWSANDGSVHNPSNSDEARRGTQLATVLIAAMNSGMQTSSYWTLASALWMNSTFTSTGQFDSGVMNHGLLPWLQESSVPSFDYYAWSMIANYTRNGKVYEGVDDSNGVHLSAIQTDSGDWTIIVVNTNANDVEISIDFEKALNKKLYRRTYNPATQKRTVAARLIDVDKAFSTVSTQLNDIICANGVQVYTSIKN